MALINFADKQAMGTQPSIPEVNKITDSNINEIKNAVNSLEAQYCKATITTTPTVSSNFQIPLDIIGTNIGGFSLSNGGIKIPIGINHIRVCGSIFLDDYSANQYYAWGKIIRIRNNNIDYYSGSISTSTSTFISCPIPPTIIDVQENDIIKLIVESPGGGKIRGDFLNTWIFIEKID